MQRKNCQILNEYLPKLLTSMEGSIQGAPMKSSIHWNRSLYFIQVCWFGNSSLLTSSVPYKLEVIQWDIPAKLTWHSDRNTLSTKGFKFYPIKGTQPGIAWLNIKNTLPVVLQTNVRILISSFLLFLWSWSHSFTDLPSFARKQWKIKGSFLPIYFGSLLRCLCSQWRFVVRTTPTSSRKIPEYRWQLTQLTGLLELSLLSLRKSQLPSIQGRESILISDLIAYIIEQHKLKAGKPVNITTIPEQCSICRPDAFYNILGNLIDNAAKTSPEIIRLKFYQCRKRCRMRSIIRYGQWYRYQRRQTSNNIRQVLPAYPVAACIYK